MDRVSKTYPELSKSVYIDYAYEADDAAFICMYQKIHGGGKHYYIPRAFTTLLQDKFGERYVETSMFDVSEEPSGWLISDWHDDDDLDYIFEVIDQFSTIPKKWKFCDWRELKTKTRIKFETQV